MKPSIWQVGIMVTQIMFSGMHFSTAASKECGALQYEMYDPKNPKRTVKCEDCPDCPPGWGVPKQCGSRIPNGTSIKCKRCEINKTFSKTNDSSMCNLCNECHKKIVLQQCTLTQDRKCGGCPKKHFLEPHLDDCRECFFCCPNIPENPRMEQCEALGIPRDEWCEATKENRLCKQNLSYLNDTNITGIIRPTTKSTTRTEWKSNNTHSGSKVTPGFNYSANSRSYTTANYANETGNNNSSKLAIITTSICAVALLIVGVIIYKKCSQRHSGPKHKNQEYDKVEQGDHENVEMDELRRMAHNSRGCNDDDSASASSPNNSTDVSTASSLESVHVNRNKASLDNNATNNSMECQGQKADTVVIANPAQQNVDFDIERIPEDYVISDMEKLTRETEAGHIDVMKFHVQTKLDPPETPQRKTWHSVGLALQVNPEVLETILSSPIPTNSALEYFKTQGDREPKMRLFVRALIGCDRKDLAVIICNWPYDVLSNTHRQAH
ncbi:uncharacterized protein [Montipora foliosa]|uniref:uncharacterized protein isoform X1 n=2 Tax=Montipora foliosa TaxID=591990 RepID=UPI0035F190FF